MGDTLEGILGQKGSYVSITTLYLNKGSQTRASVLWVLSTSHLGKKTLLGDESADFQHCPLSVPHRPVTGRQGDGSGEASTHACTPSKTSTLDAESAAHTETRLPLQNKTARGLPFTMKLFSSERWPAKEEASTFPRASRPLIVCVLFLDRAGHLVCIHADSTSSSQADSRTETPVASRAFPREAAIEPGTKACH